MGTPHIRRLARASLDQLWITAPKQFRGDSLDRCVKQCALVRSVSYIIPNTTPTKMPGFVFRAGSGGGRRRSGRSGSFTRAGKILTLHRTTTCKDQIAHLTITGSYDAGSTTNSLTDRIPLLVGIMPIDRLNLDTLAMTFEFCVELDQPSGKHLGWILLSHVCRRWRAVLLALPPIIWGKVVCYSQTRNMFEVMLKRAHNAPLTLEIRDVLGSTCFPKFITPQEFDSMLDRACTIVWLKALWNPQLVLAGRTLPKLKSLSINDVYYHDHDHSLHAPALQHLRITDISWPIIAPNLRTLHITILEIVEVSDDKPWLAELPDVLEACPALEHISLESYVEVASDWVPLNASIQAGMKALDRGRPAIQMRHLRHMDVGADAFFLAYLWRSLVVPLIATAHLTVVAGIGFAPELIQAIQSRFSRSSCSDLQISHSYTKGQIVLSNSAPGEEEPACTLDFPSDEHHFAFVNALSRLSGAVCENLRALHIIYEDDDPCQETFITGGVGAYATIESLEFTGRVGVLSRILDLYEFPRLQAITLNAGQHHKHSEMQALAQKLPTRPSKLKCLTLRGTRVPAVDGETRALCLQDTAQTVIVEQAELLDRSLCPTPEG
ncbi:hypothetical protein PENSPDRAFT_751635 [Peniophora sp. CONT]|nr:hypothetical protein PENSPDRAFT_751635 [Peniophora sp. CONT]